MRITLRIASVTLFLFSAIVALAQAPAFTRQEDVVYGRKFGTALTLDVFTPKENANGMCLVAVESGGWFSSHDNIQPGFYAEFIRRGYTVFAVCHGSQPKYTIPEILQDMNRAVRFIRSHASDYKVDPDRIGIFGASAGGHLSLMQGTAGEAGKPEARDPVDRASSRVQAVACFFPPTDFLNYGAAGTSSLDTPVLKPYRPPFDFHEMDKTENRFERIKDEAKVKEIVKQISPIYHISAETPPTLIIHGDADKLVPLQQSQSFIEKLKAAGVPCELVVKPGLAHGWVTMGEDTKTLADWFDKYLKKK